MTQQEYTEERVQECHASLQNEIEIFGIKGTLENLTQVLRLYAVEHYPDRSRERRAFIKDVERIELILDKIKN